MTRSIHETRAELAWARGWDRADPVARAEGIETIQHRLGQKRRIKRATRVWRAGRPRIDGPLDVDALPVRVLNDGPFVHHAASPDDIRAVLRRLPCGMADGLGLVELSLGRRMQERTDEGRAGHLEDDPYTGRLGHQILPNMWTGQVYGDYVARKARIRIFAFVYPPDLPDLTVWHFWMRLHALGTLVHEVGHHFDNTVRRREARASRDPRNAGEVYAEASAYDLVRRCVVPYLEEAYPSACGAFLDWVEHHGGVRLPLATLAGDPRITARGGGWTERGIMSLATVIRGLATEVSHGRHPLATRLSFAEAIHHRGLYDEAHAVIAGVLAKKTACVEALSLQAHIYHDQELHDRAREVAERVVAMDDTDVRAWTALLHTYEAQEEWILVLAATARLFDLHGGSRTAPNPLRRATAWLRLGDVASAEQEIATAETMRLYTPAIRWITRLRAEIAAL